MCGFMRRYSATHTRQNTSTLPLVAFLSVAFLSFSPLLFQSHPLSTLLVLPSLHVEAPSSMKADREKEGERKGGVGVGG